MILPNLLPDAKPEDILMLAQLHLGAPMLLTQAALEGMRARRFGRIVFVSSRAAMGAATRSAYSATKAGVHGMARTWALELAASGITVNVVAPGPILTDNFWGIIPKGSEQQERMARNVPVGRLGSREDVAHAIEFFLDERSDFRDRPGALCLRRHQPRRLATDRRRDRLRSGSGGCSRPSWPARARKPRCHRDRCLRSACRNCSP